MTVPIYPIIPAKGYSDNNPIVIPTAAPWENPPITIRFEGIPASISSRIRRFTI